MEKALFTSKTSEVRCLITEFMGQIQREVERKDIVEYVQNHVEREVTDGVIAGAIKVMTADGEIYPVRRGVYVRGFGKTKDTIYEKIYNVCRRFQIDLDRACTFNMLELTEAEKRVYPNVLELSKELRNSVSFSMGVLEAVVEIIQEGEKTVSEDICLLELKSEGHLDADSTSEIAVDSQTDANSTSEIAVDSQTDANSTSEIAVDSQADADSTSEIAVDSQTDANNTSEIAVDSQTDAVSTSEIPENTPVEQMPTKKRGRRSKRN